jgi:pimeloyl-ACP methyl ester carboxylesterase
MDPGSFAASDNRRDGNPPGGEFPSRIRQSSEAKRSSRLAVIPRFSNDLSKTASIAEAAPLLAWQLHCCQRSGGRGAFMTKTNPTNGQGCCTPTTIHNVGADGVNVFYRAAGDTSAPVVLLLHGFPTSSFMFRELIPRLAEHYRVIAPDLPGFGFTKVPAERNYVYTFDALAKTIDAFSDALKLRRYAIYVFDYGAPTGFRLATAHPERITAIVSQNGNAYEEGLGDAWGPIRKYWSEPTAENREAIRKAILNLDGTRWQYTHGVANPDSVPPESYTLDTALLERPGNQDIQLDLFLNYASNVKLYPKFQEYFRNSKPPLLAIWGKNDPFFIPAGAEAFRKDIPNAQIQFLDTGHFALETHVIEIAAAMKEFLDNALRVGHAGAGR